MADYFWLGNKMLASEDGLNYNYIHELITPNSKVKVT
jgi:hypothetical protein